MLLLQRDCHPAYFFLCAATACIERRRSAEQMREGDPSLPLGSQRGAPLAGVGPGRGVGQVVKEGGKRLTDAEFLAWLEVLIKQSSCIYSTAAHIHMWTYLPHIGACLS